MTETFSALALKNGSKNPVWSCENTTFEQAIETIYANVDGEIDSVVLIRRTHTK